LEILFSSILCTCPNKHNLCTLYPMWLSHSPLCSWGAGDETSANIVCECAALASLRHVYLVCFCWSQKILRM
jgi:hypothetical protein